MYKRKNGIYYTPDEISLLVCKYLQKQYIHSTPKSVLEPSSGEGSYVDALLQTFSSAIKVTAVEKNKATEKKLSRRFNNFKNITTFNSDFLRYYKTDSNKFDLIIGNPPYVKKGNISDFQYTEGKNLISKFGIKKCDFMNLWVAFVLISIEKLTDDGIFSFILPSELLQISYSSPIRDLLLKSFDLVEVVKFNDGVFVDLQQNVIVLNCLKKSKRKGLLYTLLNTDTPENPTFTELDFIKSPKLGKKWINGRISNNKVNFINKLAKKLPKINELCEAAPGIVTGANDFFLKSEKAIEEISLNRFKSPILQKGEFASSLLNFQEEDFEELRISDRNCYLVDLSGSKRIGSNISKYIKEGQSKNIHKRFKCKQRDKWFIVPNLQVGQGYFFKRTHKYPKMIKNSHEVLATDTAYRINMRSKSNDINSLVFSFYNSLTLIHSELGGRVYGGGVLELTPSEFKNIPIPYKKIPLSIFNKADNIYRKTNDIEKLIEFVDNELLIKRCGFPVSTVTKLKNIRRSLVAERLN